MRSPAPWLALALVAFAGCDRGRAAPPAARPAILVGDAGATRVLALEASGAVLGVAADAPAIDAPVRALLARADGSVVVLQDVDAGAPPAVVVSAQGARLATFDSADHGGAPLFDASSRAWAAAEGQDGRIWITGRTEPVLFLPGGALDGFAATLPAQTRGIAALPDGRMLVTYGANGAALYGADGAAAEPLGVSFGSAAYHGVDAVAHRPDGTFVLAALRHGIATEGVLVPVGLEPGGLVALADPELSARLPTLPSSIAVSSDDVVAGPGIGPFAEPACAVRLSADLTASEGCLTPGAHRGVARLP